MDPPHVVDQSSGHCDNADKKLKLGEIRLSPSADKNHAGQDHLIKSGESTLSSSQESKEEQRIQISKLLDLNLETRSKCQNQSKCDTDSPMLVEVEQDESPDGDLVTIIDIGDVVMKVELPDDDDEIDYSADLDLDFITETGENDEKEDPDSVTFSKKQIQEMCNYGLAITKDMKEKVTLKNGTYQCIECPYKNKRMEQFRNHLSIHRPGNPYICPALNCTYIAPVLPLLKIHLESHNTTLRYKCPLCPSKFKNKSCLNGHRYGHIKVKCRICKKSFPKTSLTSHMKTHSKTRPTHTCTHCGDTFISQIGWRRHVDRHLGINRPKRYICYFCSSAWETPTALEDHVSVHTLERPHSCPKCNLWVKTKPTLTSHMQIHAEVRPSLPCPKCDIIFKRKTDLDKHLQFVHDKDKQTLYTCDIDSCTYSTVRPRDIKKHQMMLHLHEYSHHCPHCGKGYSEGFQLKMHLLHTHTEMNKRPLPCSVSGCKKRFATQQAVRAHMVVHQNEKNFACDQCGKKYKRASSLRCHTERNHPPLEGKGTRYKHFCYFCPKSFMTSSAKLKHIRDHTMERPYQCDRCDLRLKSGEMLTYHLMKVHSFPTPLPTRKPSDPRFPCSDCGKSYSVKSGLTQHRKLVHEKTAELFKCDECDYVTPHKTAMANHVKRVHLDELYECKKCDEKFKKPSKLSEHVRLRHTKR